MNVVSHDCPNCGTALNFNPSTQTWICNYCKVEYRIDNLQSNINKYNNTNISYLDELECSNCGAKVVTDKNTSATTCAYCNSSVIVKRSLVGEYKPDYIIPFRQNKEQVLELFMKHINSKWLIDRKFCKKENIKSITGLYIPLWLVSCDVMASISGSTYGTKDSLPRRYRRLGKMKLDRVAADGKSNLNNELLRGVLPYDYSEMINFEFPYLAGCFAEKFDESKDEVFKTQVKEDIKQAAIDKLLKTVFGNGANVENTNFFADAVKYEYMLVPVWLIKMEYNGKIYEYCVNDQTNQVAGKYPVMKSARLLLSIFSLLITFIVFLLFAINGSTSNGLMVGGFALTTLLTATFNIIGSYNKIKTSINSGDYVKKGSFVLLDKQDMQSF